MFYGLDPLYFVFLAPALLLSAWASWKVHQAYAEGGRSPRPPASTRRTAEAILRVGSGAGPDRGGRGLPVGSL